MNNAYINIKRIAEVKGLKSTRSIRIAIQKGKYIAREVKVNGGTSYEILYSSLESEIQEKLENEEIKSTALIPVENKVNFISENAKLNALARVDIITALFNLRTKFAKPYNARAKVIERFFLEFQEEFEKMMPSYIGTSIEDNPAWLKRGEKLHKQMHQNNRSRCN